MFKSTFNKFRYYLCFRRICCNRSYITFENLYTKCSSFLFLFLNTLLISYWKLFWLSLNGFLHVDHLDDYQFSWHLGIYFVTNSSCVSFTSICIGLRPLVIPSLHHFGFICAYLHILFVFFVQFVHQLQLIRVSAKSTWFMYSKYCLFVFFFTRTSGERIYNFNLIKYVQFFYYNK